jgi:hypothetical protein
VPVAILTLATACLGGLIEKQDMQYSALNLDNCSMKELVQVAWAERQNYDLTGIGYGLDHWGKSEKPITKPFPYYFFLAGMVKVTNASRIVEIGTHQGGSTRAMAKALEARNEGQIVTFDVTPYGHEMFVRHDFIRAWTCEANSETAFNHVVEQFGEPRIDLVFIDASHRFWPTLLNVLIYGETCAARFMILDDVTLNPEMSRLWDLLTLRYGHENIIDASKVDPVIRCPQTGFGVVRCAGIGKTANGTSSVSPAGTADMNFTETLTWHLDLPKRPGARSTRG